MGTTLGLTFRRAWLPLLCLVLSAYFVREVPEINGDGRLAFVYAVVDQRTLAVDDYVREDPAILEDLATIGDHHYMAKAPLLALLAVPPYALLRLVFPPAHLDSWWWRWILTLIVSGGSLAATAAIVQRLAEAARLSSPRLAGLATALATPLVVYATLFMADALAAALLAGLVLAALPPRARPFSVGLLAGALLSTDAVAAAGAFVPVAFVGWRLARAREIRGLARLAAGGGLGAAPLLLYQLVLFGSPISSVYAHLGDPVVRAPYEALRIGPPPPDVLLALLFAPRNGLFVVAPIALLGAVLLVRMLPHKHGRTLAAIAGGSAAFTVVALAALPRDLVFWYDRAEYGPRLLIPVLPLLCWPLAAVRARPLALMTLVGALPQLAALSVRQPMLSPDTPVQVFEVLRRAVGDVPTPSLVGMAMPRAFPDRMWAAAVALVLVVAALLGRVVVGPREDRGRM